jgi:hypothetical protein
VGCLGCSGGLDVGSAMMDKLTRMVDHHKIRGRNFWESVQECNNDLHLKVSIICLFRRPDCSKYLRLI